MSHSQARPYPFPPCRCLRFSHPQLLDNDERLQHTTISGTHSASNSYLYFGNPVVQWFTKTSQAISNLEYPETLWKSCRETHACCGTLATVTCWRCAPPKGIKKIFWGPGVFMAAARRRAPKYLDQARPDENIVATNQGNQFPPKGLSETVGIDDLFCELMILQVLRFYGGGREQKGA